MTSNIQKEIDKLIELYFNQPKVLYEHLFASYHQFVGEIIPYSLIQEQNYFYENVDKELIYLHGFKCSNIRIKPSTFENDNEIVKNHKERLSQLDDYLRLQRPVTFNTKYVEQEADKILVSFKAGKKVATITKFKATGINKEKGVIVPRGTLHEQSVYGKIKFIEKRK